MTERATLELSPRRDVTMHHVVLCLDRHAKPVAVCITTNPLEHRHAAQVVMHKTRSHGCAVQVARYVRRTFDVEEPVTTHRAVRHVEAMIGYACAGGYQHGPDSYPSEILDVVKHVADTRISDLLAEVAGGHNASRTRYVVYEVRHARHEALRGVTNKFAALERRYLEAPPDSYVDDRPDWRPEIVQIGRYAAVVETESIVASYPRAGDGLWTRKPPIGYLRQVLRETYDPERGEHGLIWSCDGSPAVRRHYDFAAVVIGPHVYTETQVLYVLRHGTWHDGRHR